MPLLSILGLHLCLYSWLLLPKIFPAYGLHEVRITNSGPYRKLEKLIHTLTVSHQHTCYIILRDHVRYGLRTDRRRFFSRGSDADDHVGIVVRDMDFLPTPYKD